MAETTAASTAKTALDNFLKLTGYKASDIVGSNIARRTFVTSNGGKYIVNRNGKAVRVALGPDYPNSKKTEEGDDE
jgi:hypothetical protein